MGLFDWLMTKISSLNLETPQLNKHSLYTLKGYKYSHIYLCGFQEGQHWAKHMGQSEVLVRENMLGNTLGTHQNPNNHTKAPPPQKTIWVYYRL
jgi:hypothetical protein